MMTKRILSLVAVSVVMLGGPVQGQEGTESGLELSISQIEGTAASPAFIIALHNAGKEDRVLHLGMMMLTHGKALYPTAVQLMLTDASGNRRALSLRGPTGGAGLDDYIVPLKIGATYSFRVALDEYWSPSTQEFDLALPKGTYHVTARYVGEARFINRGTGVKLLVWEGELESKPIEFSIRTNAIEVAGKEKVTSDPIDRLVDQLSKTHGLWTNGEFPILELPSTATKEELVSKVFQMTGFDQGQVTNYKILRMTEVQIPIGILPEQYTAVLVETNFGEKIVLLKYQGETVGWWSRVYDAKVEKENEKGCRFRAMGLKAGMNREQVEQQVTTLLGTQNTYSPYGNSLRGGTVEYRDGNCVLAVTYNAGAPAPMVNDSQGHAGHYPPIDETLLEYKIFRETPN